MNAIKNNKRLLSAAEQTRLTWAKNIEDYDHIPPAFREAFKSQFSQSEVFPYTLLTPSFAGFLRPVQEKLVCCTEQTLTVFEKYPEHIGFTKYSFDAVNYVETGKVLLYSWLTVYGIDQQGEFCSTTLRFNTVGERLFKPILDRIRPNAELTSEAELRTEQAKFYYLVDLNYKLMNFGRHSLRTGDKVRRIILQPEQREVILKLFRKSFTRLVFPAHIFILTDKEVINIRDASKIASYGGIWNYVPLRKVRTAFLDEEDGRLRFCLKLALNNRIDFPFETSRRAEVEILQNEIKTALSDEPSAE